jgi:hypothetical protein
MKRAFKAVKSTCVRDKFRSKFSFVYTVGETYTMKGPPTLCRHGFHACDTVLQCFVAGNGYSLDRDPVLEVELGGVVVEGHNKFVGTVMRVVRVLSWAERHVELHKEQLVTDKGITWRLKGLKPHSGDDDLPAVHCLLTGLRMWYRDGILHRDGDAPAVIHGNGDVEYVQRSRLHREHDRPAVVYANGDRMWFLNGVLHRDHDAPAIVYMSGTCVWYRHGAVHRAHGAPAVICPNNDRAWYTYGELVNVVQAREKECHESTIPELPEIPEEVVPAPHKTSVCFPCCSK